MKGFWWEPKMLIFHYLNQSELLAYFTTELINLVYGTEPSLGSLNIFSNRKIPYRETQRSTSTIKKAWN
jgi:hypothetical protein